MFKMEITVRTITNQRREIWEVEEELKRLDDNLKRRLGLIKEEE